MVASLQRQLPDRYVGPGANQTGFTRLSSDRGTVFHPPNSYAPESSVTKVFAIDFYNPDFGVDQGYEQGNVAQVLIERKAGELSEVLKYVEQVTGSGRAIVVGHSLGGLVGRAYLEGLALAPDGVTSLKYQNDVAKLITIDTPNEGSDWANVLQEINIKINLSKSNPLEILDPDLVALASCLANPSRDRDELEPGSPFLRDLNQGRAAIDPSLPSVVSIATKYTILDTGPVDGDGIVEYDSQNLTHLFLGSPKITNRVLELVYPSSEISRMGSVEVHTVVPHLEKAVTLVNNEVLATPSANGPPHLDAMPTSAAQGTTFAFSGTNFTANATARLFIRRPGSAWTVLSATSDVNGNVSWQVPTTCADPVGSWSVVARDDATWLKGDLNGDGIVNSLDWSWMNNLWFTSDQFADINHDGIVNSLDFSLLNQNWFKQGPVMAAGIIVTGGQGCVRAGSSK